MSLFSGLSVSPPSPAVETDSKDEVTTGGSGSLFSGLGGSAFNFIAEEPSVAPSPEGGLSAFNFIGNETSSAPPASTGGPSAFSFLGSESMGSSEVGAVQPSSLSAFNFTTGGLASGTSSEANITSASTFSFLSPPATTDAPSTTTVDLLSVGLTMDTPAPPPAQQSLSLDTFSEPTAPRKKTRKAMRPGHAARNDEAVSVEDSTAAPTSAPTSPPPTSAPTSPPPEEVEPSVSPTVETSFAPAVEPTAPSVHTPAELQNETTRPPPPPPEKQSTPTAPTSLLAGLSQAEVTPSTSSLLAGLTPAEPETVSAPTTSILAGLSQAAPREIAAPSQPVPPPPVSPIREVPTQVVKNVVEAVPEVVHDFPPAPPAEETLESMTSLESTQQWMELQLSTSMEEQRALLEQEAACLARSQKMTSDVASLRQQLASTEADQNALCDAEQFEEAEALEANIQQLKDAITRRLEEVAGTSRQMETLARSLLDLTRQREDLAEQVLKKMHSLQSDGEDSLTDLDDRAQRRLAAENNRIESEKKRIELACSHLKKDSENLDEEKHQLQEAIEQQTTTHVQERDKAVTERQVMDDEIKELQKTLEARMRQRKTLTEIVDSCEIRIASIKSKFEKQLSRLDGKQKRLEEAQREVETDAQQVEQMAAEHQRERKACTEDAAQRKRQLDELQKESRKLLRMRKVMSRHLSMRSRWQQLLEPHQEMLNKARLRWESFTGDCLAQASSLSAREAESNKLRSQLDAIRIQMPTLEAEKKVAVASRSFKEAGRLSEEIKKREEERKAYESELENLQNNLTAQRENLASSRQLEEGAQAELMDAEAKSGAEELRILQRQIRDLHKLRRNSCMGATERILFEEEERVFKSAQTHLAEKCGISLDTLEGIPSEEEDNEGDDTSEVEDEPQNHTPTEEVNRQASTAEIPSVDSEEVIDVEALRQQQQELVNTIQEREQRLADIEKEIEQACETEQYDRAEELEAERLIVEKVLEDSKSEVARVENILSQQEVVASSENVAAHEVTETSATTESIDTNLADATTELPGNTISNDCVEESPENDKVAHVESDETSPENDTVASVDAVVAADGSINPDVNATEESSTTAVSGFSFVGSPPVEVTEETEAPSGFSFVGGSTAKSLEEEEPVSGFAFVGGSGGSQTLNADDEHNHEDECSPEAATEEAF